MFYLPRSRKTQQQTLRGKRNIGFVYALFELNKLIEKQRIIVIWPKFLKITITQEQKVSITIIITTT